MACHSSAAWRVPFVLALVVTILPPPSGTSPRRVPETSCCVHSCMAFVACYELMNGTRSRSSSAELLQKSRLAGRQAMALRGGMTAEGGDEGEKNPETPERDFAWFRLKLLLFARSRLVCRGACTCVPLIFKNTHLFPCKQCCDFNQPPAERA